MPASLEPTRVLILGGTGEAAALAGRLAADPRFAVVSSLAGATRRPAPIAGRVVRGGFGGIDGLADFLTSERVERCIDATHPYAARISAHAAEACRQTGVRLLRLDRPAWRAGPDDRWIEADGAAAAAAALSGLGHRVFLSLGRKELAAFARLDRHWFLVRLIEPPEAPLPLSAHELVLGRGPFSLDGELALLRQHTIDTVVSKNSGGTATHAKIEAARQLGLPVVMLRRPPPPADVASVPDVAAALAWLHRPAEGV